ncbi:hypothetical protein ACFE04_005070 [Oxalis oulophora]
MAASHFFKHLTCTAIPRRLFNTHSSSFLPLTLLTTQFHTIVTMNFKVSMWCKSNSTVSPASWVTADSESDIVMDGEDSSESGRDRVVLLGDEVGRELTVKVW